MRPAKWGPYRGRLPPGPAPLTAVLADWLAARLRHALAGVAGERPRARPARRIVHEGNYSERDCGMPASSARTSVSR